MRLMRKRIIGSALLLMLSLSVTTDAVDLQHQRLRLDEDSGPVMAVWELATLCAADIEQVLKIENTGNKWINIHFELEKKSVLPPNLIFHPSDSYPVITHALSRAFLWRITDAQIAIDDLDWLAAAITYNVLYSERPAPGIAVPDYRTARYLFHKERIPDLEKMLAQKITPGDHALYHLYAMQSHLLLKALQKSGSNPAKPEVRRVLVHLAKGSTLIEAISSTAKAAFRDDDDLQTWYSRSVRAICMQGTRGLATAEVARRLHDLETVPIVMPGQREFGVVQVPLDELPKRLESYRLNHTAIANIQGEVYQLLRESAGFLEQPLLDYVAAFKILAQGKQQKFKTALAEARLSFKKAMERQQDLIIFLDRIERQENMRDDQFKYYLQATKSHQQRQLQLDPALHFYLDQIESSL